jgi:DNA N-6-adenine-methyltransferase (Dam)
MEQIGQIVLIDRVESALQAATTVQHVKNIRDRASAAREYGRRARDRRMVAMADQLLFKSERRTGEIILAMKAAGELVDRKNGRPQKGSSVTRLSDLGISFDESARWQKLANMPQDAFDETLRARFDRIVQRDVTAANGFIKNGAFSSATAEHLTPREVLDAVLDVLGEIDLDPCAEAHGDRANLPARDHFTKKDDGLSKPWTGRVFMNPPYGSEVPKWVERLLESHKSGEVTEAIALLAARTDTRWFNALDEWPVCFVTGRLSFLGANTTSGSAMFPSAIFYLGTAHRAAFERRLAQLGSVRPPAIRLMRGSTRKGKSAPHFAAPQKIGDRQ